MNRRSAALLRPFGLMIAILMATFAGVAPSVLANDTPGNNGTVKIHEGNTENDPGEVRNEPHVCTFHLHFYFADPEQAGTWEIQEWAPGDKGTVVLSGTYDTAGDGEDREPDQGVYTLPDGHYKLFWDGDLDTDKHDKMKVFWVDCEEESPAPSGSELPIESSSVPPSAPASASVPPSAPASASVPPSVPAGSVGPIVGSPSVPASQSPSGGVAGATGTPAVGVTPPPTDTSGLSGAGDDSWRVVLLGLAALIAAAVFIVPTPTAGRVANRSQRPRR